MSVDSNGMQGDSGADVVGRISSDGRYVAFCSSSANMAPGDTNGTADIFVRDCQNGTTERVSVATGGTEGNSYSLDPAISSDGRVVAFVSFASNLVAGDTNGRVDVFVRDESRWYLVYYRDPIVLGGCPASSTFNATQTGRIDWSL